MSRLSELAATMQTVSEQQAEHMRQALESVIQQQIADTESALSAMQRGIEASMRETGERVEQQLTARLTARPKRIALLWWAFSGMGVLVALSMWGVSVWQFARAVDYYHEAQNLKESGAIVTQCEKTKGKTVPCVLVRTESVWKVDKGTQYMEIKR